MFLPSVRLFAGLTVRGSPTCINLAASLGLDTKVFTCIASVYRDRCEQSLEYSSVVARFAWVLRRS